MPEDEEKNQPEDSSIDPSSKSGDEPVEPQGSDPAPVEGSDSDQPAASDDPPLEDGMIIATPPEDEKPASAEAEAAGAPEPPGESGKPPDKPTSDEAGGQDAEAAMLAMMEGKEVGEEGSSFDEQLADLPETAKVSPDSISYEETIARPADFQQLSGKPPGEDKRSIDMLLDVSLPISIELGRTKMSISDILALGPGSVVELNKLAGEPVEVLVNQKTVALGEVVVVDENFGVRVTQLLSPEDRIKTLQE